MTLMEAIVAITVSIVAAVPATIAAIAAIRSARNAKQTNDAVNHTHKTGTPRLYDVVLETQKDTKEILDWKKTYDASPWSDGHGVGEWLHDHNEDHRKIKESLESIHKKLDERTTSSKEIAES